MDIAAFAIALLVGVGIGVLSGLLGIGGGTVMVPVFKLGFGMSAIGATATSLLAIIPTAISGGITHVRQKTCIPLLGVLAGIGGACLSPIGVRLAALSPGWAIMLAAACVIAYSSITMLKKALKMPRSQAAPMEAAQAASDGAMPADPDNDAHGATHVDSATSADSATAVGAARAEATAVGTARAEVAAAATRADASAPRIRVTAAKPADGAYGEYGFRHLWKGLLIGALAGLVAGYVGVGGGFLMVPLFMSILRIDMRLASGSSLLAIGILSSPGAIMQIALGNAHILIALAVVIGSVPGAVLGARLVKRVPERALRFVFAGVLFVAAVLLVLQELGIG